jgi:MFS family permease
LGILTLALAWRYLPKDLKVTKATTARFDVVGTVILVLTLAAYALAMTIGRGSFGQLNIELLFLSLIGLGMFVITESRAEAPLIQMDTFKNPLLSAGFTMSALVTTVVMATLVVGPFYLSGALGLDPAHVGLVMSSGPIIAALTGAPAGRLVDRMGAYRMGIFGLIGMVIGTSLLALLPTGFGVPGYVAPLVVITGSYALFQAANNTAVMTNIRPNQRGVISGVLNLSRNLGLITGASVMGTVFATGAASANLMTAPPEALVSGMRLTFAVATGLLLLALAIAFMGKALSNRTPK